MRLIFSLFLGAARTRFTSRASNGALERTAASAALETTRPSAMMGSGYARRCDAPPPLNAPLDASLLARRVRLPRNALGRVAGPWPSRARPQLRVPRRGASSLLRAASA